MFRFAKANPPANDVGGADGSGVPRTRTARGDAGRKQLRDELKGVAQGARAGDSQATQTLLSTLGPPMLRAIRKILGNAEGEAGDVLQDAMFGFMKALDGFRDECSVTHFACRIAVMTALVARRRLGRRGSAEAAQSPPALLELVATDSPDPSAEAEAAARREVLWRLLDELPPLQAEALALHCVEGFTIDEVAAAGGYPADTVKSRLRLAKATLRTRIAEDLAASDLFEGDL